MGSEGTYVYTGLDFFLDDVSAAANGIILQGEPVISALEANVETVDIPGRSGSLHLWDGTYKDRTITFACYAVGYSSSRDTGFYEGGDGVYAELAAANAFLFPRGNGAYLGYRKLKFGYEDTYWKAILVNGGETQARLKTLAPFELTFLVNPIRYTSDDIEAGI